MTLKDSLNGERRKTEGGGERERERRRKKDRVHLT